MPRSLRTSASTDELQHFTNREKEQDVFRRLVDLPEGSLLPIVMFYGVGGAGKSWLLKKLRAELPANVASARLDFDPSFGGISYHTDQTSALAELRRQFGEKKIAFPRFDLAYAFLCYKEQGKDEPRFRGSGFLGGALEFLAEATEAFADFPGANLATWAAKKIASSVWTKVKDSALVEYLKQRVGEADFLALQKMSPQDIYPLLLDRFLLDLAEGAPQRDGKACRAVILLDTVEALRIGLSADAHVSRREQWLRDLHRTDSPILLVLAGRDQLRWGDADPDYREPPYLEQHLIGGLSADDARLYLTRCGIDDTSLQDAVLRASLDTETAGSKAERGYHPFSLGLCQDAIRAEMQQGRTVDPASFDLSPGDFASLARRFLMSLGSDALVLWVRQLALTPRFDETAARAAFSATRDVHQDAAWQHLRTFSFLRATDQPGWHTLHSRMRAALIETADTDWKASSHREWERRWSERAVEVRDDFAGLMWYHQHCQDRKKARNDWVQAAVTLRRSRRMADHFAVLGWWDPVDLDLADEETAAALNGLGIETSNASLGNLTVNSNDAIACFLAALRVRTENDFPADWAESQNNLGTAYKSLPTGDRAANVAKAIECYEAALRVRTERDFPPDWATTQHNLGIAYRTLLTGNREANLAKAVAYFETSLRVFTEKEFPTQWASTQNHLGNTYRLLPTGNRDLNLAKAIACFEAALRVQTQTDHAIAWASTQTHLGNAYQSIPTGNRVANQANAIACYEAALCVFTEKDFPTDWARLQNNLGTVYQAVLAGDRSAHLTKAIAYHEAASRVFTEMDFPAEWAGLQHNLGTIYQDLPTGDRNDNLAKAVVHCEAALRVRTREAFPAEWALTLNSLGNAYLKGWTGNQDDNLIKAIACFEAALCVRTEQDYPVEWAQTQNNLGNAHQHLQSGDRDANLAKAIACYEAALRVHTEKDFPVEWAWAQLNLGNTYQQLPNGDDRLREAMACYDAAMRVCTKNDFPVDWATINQSRGIAFKNLANITKDPNTYLESIRCWEAAATVFEACGMTYAQERVQRMVTTIRDQLAAPPPEP